MPITTDDVNKMIVEATLGEVKTSVDKPGAQAYFEELRADVLEMLDKGYSVLPIAE